MAILPNQEPPVSTSGTRTAAKADRHHRQWPQNQHDQMRQTRARQAACRPIIGPDPILALPATRKERSRLLIDGDWAGFQRNHSLVPCGTHLSARNYASSNAGLIPSDLWAEAPSSEPPRSTQDSPDRFC